MTRPTDRTFRRTDLAHGADHILVPSATFRDDAGSSFTASFATETALRVFLDMVVRYPRATSTVTLFLTPRGYRPAPSALPEFLPSSLYFDLDRTHGIASAALLLVDSAGHSHQWLTQGDHGREDVALVMDPHNPEYARFPRESFIPTSLLHDIVTQWAFGDDLPPPSVSWRTAAEDEVGWPAGAGY